MKKYSILIALVLVVALAFQASAAVTINGKIDAKLTYKHSDKSLTPKMTFTLTPATVNTADPNKAYVAFRPLVSAELTFAGKADHFGSWKTSPIIGSGSYLQIKGAYTAGGQDVTTKMGYLGTLADFYSEVKSSYISKNLELWNDDASGEDKAAKWLPNMPKAAKGISVTGGKIADASIDLYYLEPASDNPYVVAIVKKDAFDARYAYNLKNEDYRFTFGVDKYAVTSNLKAYGYVDYNGLETPDPVQTWKAGAEFKAADDAVFDGYYRSNETYDVNGTFKLNAGELNPTVVVGYKDIILDDDHVQGVYANAMTDIANMKVGVGYDDTIKTTYAVAGNMYGTFDEFIEHVAVVEDETTSDVSEDPRGQRETGNLYGAVLELKEDTKVLRLGTTQDLVKALNLNTKAVIYARAGATLDLNDSENNVTWGQLYGQTDITTIPGFNKITVSGRVHVSSNADTKYGVGAIYTAPNGILFRAGYNWKIGKAYNDVKNYIDNSGFVVEASRTINF